MNLGEKKIRTMAAKILSVIESIIDDDINNLSPTSEIRFLGSDIKMIRNEVLDLAGDTIRAIRDINIPNGLTKEELGALLGAEGNNALIIKSANLNILYGLRNKIGAGVVYNNMYICRDIVSLINKVVPYLDQVYNAKFNIMGGNYQEWRNNVCRAYLGENK